MMDDCQAGMTSPQIKAAEVICNEQSQVSKTVYSKIVSLAQAKSIQGLRAVFDEVCFNAFSILLPDCYPYFHLEICSGHYLIST